MKTLGEGKKAAKRIGALDRAYRANIAAFQSRIGNAYRVTASSV